MSILSTNLTIAIMAFMLSRAGNKSATGFDILETNGANRHQRGFFMRKISALHIMSGWAGSRKAGRVVCPVCQPAQSGAMFDIMWPGLKPHKRITIMNPSTQAQTEQNQTKTPNRISLDDLIKQQDKQRGLTPLRLEPELLLKRVADGGHSGQFLADAFISAYRTTTPFQHSLGELIKLDTEGFRLFHQILHIRHISGWSDNNLYQIEQQIIAIVGSAL